MKMMKRMKKKACIVLCILVKEYNRIFGAYANFRIVYFIVSNACEISMKARINVKKHENNRKLNTLASTL